MADGEKLIQPWLWCHRSWLGGFSLARCLSLNGVLYFLEEMGLVGFCFVGPAWLWPVGFCS